MVNDTDVFSHCKYNCGMTTGGGGGGGDGGGV